MGVEVSNFHLVSLNAPFQPQETVIVFMEHDDRQRIPDVVIKGGVLEVELQVTPPVTITKNLKTMVK